MNTSKLRLPGVTLLGIDTFDVDRLMLAIRICRHYCDFGAIKVLSSIPYDDPHVICIPELTHEGYSRFCIKELNKYVETPHVLIVQHDGFILNPAAWTDEFLEYDYIGAPWDVNDEWNVGNGGFSLRSKQLLEKCSTLITKPPWAPEDEVICRKHAVTLSEHGIRFAPARLAERFSFEGNARYGRTWKGQFGFHSFELTDISKWNCPPLPGIKVEEVVAQCLKLRAEMSGLAVQVRLEGLLRRRQRAAHRREMKAFQRTLRGMLLEGAARQVGFPNGTAGMNPQQVEDLAVEVFSAPEAQALGVWFHRPKTHKHAAVNCAERWSVCHGACCSLSVPLTPEEVQKTVFNINISEPFTLARDAKTDLCKHWKDCKCGIYEHRPLACATYSCAEDKRIWDDFEKMIPGPAIRRYVERLRSQGLTPASPHPQSPPPATT